MTKALGIRKCLAQLVDDRFAREPLLLQAGLKSFVPAIRFVEDFCAGAEELLEYRDYIHGATRADIAPDPDFNANRAHLKRAAEERYAQSGLAWELGTTEFDRRLRRMEPKELAELKRPYRAMIKEAWGEEAGRFGLVATTVDDLVLRRSNVALYRHLMEEASAPFGFSFDKRLSSRSAPVFSRIVAGSYALCLSMDPESLNREVGSDIRIVETGELLRSWPRLNLWMNVYDMGGVKPEKIVGWQLFDFLPARLGPMGDIWSQFCNGEQLSALIGINLAAYGIVRHEMDAAIARGCAVSSST